MVYLLLKIGEMKGALTLFSIIRPKTSRLGDWNSNMVSHYFMTGNLNTEIEE